MRFGILAALLAVTISSVSPAATIFFNFGANRGKEGGLISGSGSFTTSGEAGTFTLASGITSFQATIDETGAYPDLDLTDEVTLALGDLTKLSITLDNNSITDLSLLTTYYVDFRQTPTTLNVFPADPGEFNFNDSLGAGGSFSVFIESDPVVAVPETASWIMMTLGFGLIGSLARRSRMRGISQPLLSAR